MARTRATRGRLKALLSRIAATFLGALVWVGAPTCLTYQGVTGIWNTHQLHTRAVSAPQPGRVVSRSLGRSPFVTVVFTTRAGDSVSTNIHSWPDGQPDVGDTIPVSYLPEHPDVAEDTRAPAGYGIPILALAGGLAFIGVSLGLLRRSLQGRRTPGRRDSVWHRSANAGPPEGLLPRQTHTGRAAGRRRKRTRVPQAAARARRRR